MLEGRRWGGFIGDVVTLVGAQPLCRNVSGNFVV